jgi:hypothetical protein
MRRSASLGIACSLVLAALALTASTVGAQTAQLFTVTFQLTISGTPPPAESFSVQWGETGLGLCNAACIGDGHTYTRSMAFPKGASETFVFIRGTGRPATPSHPAQHFAAQTLTVTSDHTVSAFFTFGAATVPTPSTGAPPMLYGATIASSGAVLALFAGRRRHRPPQAR